MGSKWLGKALSGFIGTAVLALGVNASVLASTEDEFVTQDDLTALKEEVKTLRDELKTIKVAKPEVAPAITGNVYSELSRKIKLGGEMRARFESFYNFDFSGKPTDTFDTKKGSHRELTLLRTRLNFDADINDYLRAFLELQDNRAFGEEQSTVGSLSDNRTDLLQGFAELKSFSPVSSVLSDLSFLVGRWRLNYGKERIIGPLDWTNQGRSWDGARLRWAGKNGNWVDGFVTQIAESFASPSVVPRTAVRASEDRDEVFWGIYGHLTFLKGIVDEIEPYFLGRNQSWNADGRKLFGTTDDIFRENRYTAGVRVAGEPTVLPGLDYDIEGNYQFGNVIVEGANFDIQDAYSIHAGAGYTCKSIAWTPRVGGKFSFASGDKDSADDELNTFDQLYPTGHAHLGYIDLVGRQNIFDYEVNLSAKPTKKWLMKVDGHWFMLDQAEDAWYDAGGNVLGAWTGAAGTDKPDRELGKEVDLTANYAMFKNFSVTLGYSHFFAGDFIQDDNVTTDGSGSGKKFGDSDADWFYVMTTLKF